MPRIRTSSAITLHCADSARRVSRAISDALNVLKIELAATAEAATNPLVYPEQREELTRRCSGLSADVEALDALREQCEFRLSSIAGRHANR